MPVTHLFTVDVYNHSQLAQRDGTASIGSGNGNLLALGDVDELLAVAGIESRFRAQACPIEPSVSTVKVRARGGSSRKLTW